ncbi:MAG: hypothetical protein JXB48_14235 [Candidatus Latescibacteria bacterium]|nr:hypothetical protein [Candidatus Latescibacterota bacterium]
MGESDSHRPLTLVRSGLPLLSNARRDLPAVDGGSLLFRESPESLDVNLCPRKAPVFRHFLHRILPADSGTVIGAFNGIAFGVYLHTSFSFLSTLRTCHYCHARKTRLLLPCLWVCRLVFHQLGFLTAFRTHTRIIHKQE